MAGDHRLIGGQVLRWVQSDNPRDTRELLNGPAEHLGELKSDAFGGSRQHGHRPLVIDSEPSPHLEGWAGQVATQSRAPGHRHPGRCFARIEELRSVEFSPTEDVIGKDRREAEGITFNDAMDQRQRGDPELPRRQHEAGPARVAVVIGENHGGSVSFQELQTTEDPLAGDH